MIVGALGIEHPVHAFICDRGHGYMVHDDRPDDPKRCRCGSPLSPFTGEGLPERPRHFLGPDVRANLKCKKCGGRSIRKVLKRTGGYCAKCAAQKMPPGVEEPQMKGVVA